MDLLLPSLTSLLTEDEDGAIFIRRRTVRSLVTGLEEAHLELERLLRHRGEVVDLVVAHLRALSTEELEEVTGDGGVVGTEGEDADLEEGMRMRMGGR